MIAALLNFLFIILLGIFIVVGVVAYKIYRTFHSVKKQFKGFRGQDNGNGQDRQQYGQGRQQYRQGRQQYRQTSDDDEIIIDRRTPDEMNRKIFSKNEGEYVDYEEEK